MVLRVILTELTYMRFDVVKPAVRLQLGTLYTPFPIPQIVNRKFTIVRTCRALKTVYKYLTVEQECTFNIWHTPFITDALWPVHFIFDSQSRGEIGASVDTNNSMHIHPSAGTAFFKR